MNIRKDINFEEIKMLYINQKLNIQKVSIILGCSTTVIRNRLKKEGIKIRNISESLKGKKHSEEHIKKIADKIRGHPFYDGGQKGWFKIGHVPIHKGKTKENYKPLKIASEKLSITRKKLFSEGKLIPFNGKENPSKRKEVREKIRNSLYHQNLGGENNPNWMGGIARLPYTWKFIKNRKNILLRDNYKCLKCSEFNESPSEKLTVHHIDYDKSNDQDKNCCTLCIRCNSEVNFNRPFWTNFFQLLLSKKYGYDYHYLENKIEVCRLL